MRLFDPDAVDAVQHDQRAWEGDEVAAFTERMPEGGPFETLSGVPVDRIYTPANIASHEPDDLGFPGRFPYTRGPYPTMYRARPWTMRQIAGYGTAADTNQRFHYLLSQGQTGLSIDFDMPTLMGLDSDDPRSLGEVGREGVAVDTLDDFRELMEGIDLEEISVSMTINPSAWILLAMYVALAKERGNDLSRLSGTTQADILKEYIAQKEWLFPVRPSVRIVRDMVVYGAETLPRFNPLNISGYHISEAGADAVQELAFTLANAIAYVEEITDSGCDVDRFAPRLSFYFVAQRDFFEEIAKFRAARRMWARIMRDRFEAKDPASMRLRFHCQTAAATLTKSEPENNIVRTALQALSAVLGGAQSLHCNGLDEAYAIPTEEAMRLALRTQQIIAQETNVRSTIDPMGGSYYVEWLTDELERRAWDVIETIDSLGGSPGAIEQGYFQREITDTAYRTARQRASGEYPVVGLNSSASPSIEVHRVSEEVEHRQCERVASVRASRDSDRVAVLLDRLAHQAAQDGTNLMPTTVDLVSAGATMGEITGRLIDVFGRYEEDPVV
jgi:methylmalonyl-CoA mutase cobalamin-binding domain/chain